MSSEVPEGWERSLLGDVLRLEYGRALSATVREEGNVPVYGSNGMVGLHSTPLVPRKGIVVGRKGTAGSVTVTDGPFWPIDTAYYVEPQQEVEFDWLASMLKHARLSDLNESTGVPGLNRDKVYREAVLIPPLAEQRRIAEVLRSVDAAITAAEASFDQCHVTQSALLDLAFSSGEPTALGNICALIYRYPGFYGFEQREAGVPVIRGEHLRAGRVSTDWSNFYFVDPEFSQQFPKTILGLGDVVMSVRGTVGTAAVVDAAATGSGFNPSRRAAVALNSLTTCSGDVAVSTNRSHCDLYVNPVSTTSCMVNPAPTNCGMVHALLS